MEKTQHTIVRLEDVLIDGMILISKKVGFLLVATYVPYDQAQENISVQSYRGVQHILLLLHSEILRLHGNEEGAEEMLRLADMSYPYDMNFTKLGENPTVDRMALKCNIHIYWRNRVILRCRQTEVPAGKDLAGVYTKQAMGSTLEEVLTAVVNKEFEWEKPIH